VRACVPFREAHDIAGRAVAYCELHGLDLPDLTDAQLAEIDTRLEPGIRAVLTVDGSLQARMAVGGTAPSRVSEQLADLTEAVREHIAWAERR
jgi:argininosuccinate lyase